jgi:UDP-2-acetamido-2-deoxy-ribo-hexuluronate aminotransferase
MQPIKMVDLLGQYQRIKAEVDAAMQQVLEGTEFIQGPAVRQFEAALSSYLDGAHVISCGNGTDALQIAMMALGYKPGDEVILPVHTYVATAEVIALLQLVPVFAEVNPDTFTIDPSGIERLITKKTVAIVPVHLYGQCADMQQILAIAAKHGLHVIEDGAQSLGADYLFLDGKRAKGCTLGTIGTTSFFPSKNLGAFGDGGAMITRDEELAVRMRMIANHGQRQKYQHDIIGVNSRLDTLQAAILSVKLKHLDDYAARRRKVADYYDTNLKQIPFLKTPARAEFSTHVFHQYTVQTKGVNRDQFKAYLQEKGIPSMIYYPIPLHLQAAYRKKGFEEGSFPVTENLSQTVLSLPIHTEMDEEQLSYICESISRFG